MEILQNQDLHQWDAYITQLPGSHALQARAWGQVKSRFGWSPHHLLWRGHSGEVNAAALLLEREIKVRGLPLSWRVMYIPRGPLLDWSNRPLAEQVLDDLQNYTKVKKTIFLKIDPDVPVGFGIPGDSHAQDNPLGLAALEDLKERGWIFSKEQIQFRNSVEIELAQDEDTLLARMKPKTRYNIRLAERRGVTVRRGGLNDLDLLYSMYAYTSVRDDFVIRGKDYYHCVWETFIKDKLAEPLIAEVDGKAVGAVVIFRFGGRAWYMYGMSLDEHREKMFNHRLQWEAILLAKAAGCHVYDMWGAPDAFVESDPLWGVYRFKEGFGGRVVRTLGGWDFIAQPLIYRLYSETLPRLLNVMRARGKSSTKRNLSV